MSGSSAGLSWMKHLKVRRGIKVLAQARTMYNLHRTPFEDLLENILNVLDKYEARFTFPVVASVARQKPELLKKIIDSKSEIAIHGYKHVPLPFLSNENQSRDFRRAIEEYKRLGIPIQGFRAPYNMYNEYTKKIIDELGFLWDAGIGFSPENRERREMFRVQIDGRDSKFICIPLSGWSDDRMVEKYNYSIDEMVKVLKKTLDEARASNGVVMFDFHPIRIGQSAYLTVLEQLVSYGKTIGGWFPTVTEAVRHRSSHTGWYEHEFCCLLTGDIDNFYFRDYIKRLV